MEIKKYEVKINPKYGRYLVASQDLKAGHCILSDEPFVLGPNSESGLVCYNCYLPLISKFNVCKKCELAPLCPGEGCPDDIPTKWHNDSECDFFKTLRFIKALHPMLMVQNVGSLVILRAILKKNSDPKGWQEFMQLETHLSQRKETAVWENCRNIVKFIQTLGILSNENDENLIQKICAAIDVNSFEVRGPLIPAISCAEILRGIYLNAALLAHDCVSNTHMAINDKNVLVCHASIDIKKGEIIKYNYTDPLKGTAVRRQHLKIGKYFICDCQRCIDNTELGTYMSSLLCPNCKTGYISEDNGVWACNSCDQKMVSSDVVQKVKCCLEKFSVINKKDQKELEEFIRNVSLVLAPSHHVLLEAKQRLAGVLRDIINREPRPNKKLFKRKIELCRELMTILEKLSPGICRTKAITLYELHAALVQLAKRLFDAREISGSAYLNELTEAEKCLKRSLEMLLVEPRNSPEGALCSKALEEYRALKTNMSNVLKALHVECKAFVTEIS